MMASCYNCGASIPPASRVCPHCNAPIAFPLATSNAFESSPTESAFPFPPPPTRPLFPATVGIGGNPWALPAPNPQAPGAGGIGPYAPLPWTSANATKMLVLASPMALPVEERPGVLAGILKNLDAVPRGFNLDLTNTLRRSTLTRPGFSGCWVDPHPPEKGDKLTSYNLGASKVTIYHIPNEIDTLYHLEIADYKLSKDEVELLHLTRDELMEYYPKRLALQNLSHTKQVVREMAQRLMQRVARETGIQLSGSAASRVQRFGELAEILTRHLVGLGALEILLSDPHLQDLYIDAPASENPIHLRIGGFASGAVGDKCITNVTVTDEEAEALLSRLLLDSGKPFSEAMPVLETDLREYNIRVTAIGKPLSPHGIAMALRRHATDPWTLLKLMSSNSINPLTAGLLNFLIDGRSTILVAGPRGAGKTSLTGALMLEFPKNQRILTIEDTLELPSAEMRELGYKVQTLFTRSAVGGQGVEMTANEALKVSLRLGESAIVLGEVRGEEARTLYEAMRAGTAGSSVLGTIHGNTAKAVFERVVHDIGIPAVSFQATDIVVVAGLTSPGGSVRNQQRRIMEVSELSKTAREPGTFRQLLVYDEATDTLKATAAYLEGSERIKHIADSWGIRYEEALEQIQLRATYRERLVELSRRAKRPELVSAEWVGKSNAAFWDIMERATEGGTKRGVYASVLSQWEAWLKESLKGWATGHGG